ncbi:methylmalonyl-CoA mutase family protein [Capnocytophaga canimorsus]|uniref:methylmalonyl-CoA mutase family protein n=1 Tax=Capnocytophaga canimorsus TaxID=28188 RepID=UPI0037CD484C
MTDLLLPFTKIGTKQWKQKLHFELNGQDYNQTLVAQTHDEVTLFPFYTTENKRTHFKVHTKSSPTATIYCIKPQKALKEIQLLNAMGIDCFSITLHFKNENWAPFFAALPKNGTYFIHPQYADVAHFSKLSEGIFKSKANINLCCDYIGRLLSVGHWFSNQSDDLQLIKDYHSDILYVNTAIYQQSGASVIQQLAYGLSQAVTYLEIIENQSNKSDIKLYFEVALSSQCFFEIAKLRALRQLTEVVFSVFSFPIKCFVIAEPSQREFKITHTNYNQIITDLAYQSAIFGGADFIKGKNALFFKKNTPEIKIEVMQRLQNAVQNQSAEQCNGNLLIDTLSAEMAEKALLLFKNIVASGGLLKQITQHTLQRKVKEKATQQQQLFDDLLHKNSPDFSNFVSKEDWEIVPFSKKNREKTFVIPLVANRLWEKLEKKHSRQ